MIKAFIVNLVVLFLLSTSDAYAIFGTVGLDPSFCQLKSVRQTIVYIDDMLMIEGKTDGANKLASKLKASLAPGSAQVGSDFRPATVIVKKSGQVAGPITAPNNAL